MVRKTKERCPQSVLFTLLPDDAKDQQEMTLRLKEAGVYKCYYTTLVVNTLVHDMYVALNME